MSRHNNSPRSDEHGLFPSRRCHRGITFAVALAAIFIFIRGGEAETPQRKGWALAKRVEKANEGFKGEVSKMEMVLLNARGDRIVRRMASNIFEVKKDGDKSKIEFLWPADVKGTRMLTWTHKSKDDDQWLYLPAIRRVKRISSRNKSGSFMGSEFAYEDLGSQEPEKYSHRFLEELTVKGRPMWKTERVPNDKRSGYSRQVQWIDKGYMSVVKVEYYDRKGELLKTSTLSNFKRYGKLWRPQKITMRNHQTKKVSILTWTQRKLFVPLDADDFSKDELDS